MTERHPLPAVEAATLAYENNRRDENIVAIAVASAEWNFTAAGLAAGRDLLARMPYNSAAVDWSEDNFDHVYQATWWPRSAPVLVLAGAEDGSSGNAGGRRIAFARPMPCSARSREAVIFPGSKARRQSVRHFSNWPSWSRPAGNSLGRAIHWEANSRF
jgi:pimeloyl-ACP methyl ester carboxylesterase